MAFRFQTRRLIIRPWRDDDRAGLERMTSDPDMMRFISGRPWTRAQVDELLERQQRHLAAHGVCFGAVELAANGEIAGLAGMQPMDDGDFELGWWIWKGYWGRGLAAEAVAPFVEHGRRMGLERLWAVIDPPNTASVRVAERLGLRHDRTVPACETIATRGEKPVAMYRIDLDADRPA